MVAQKWSRDPEGEVGYDGKCDVKDDSTSWETATRNCWKTKVDVRWWRGLQWEWNWVWYCDLWSPQHSLP